MCDVYEEACFNKKNAYIWVKYVFFFCYKLMLKKLSIEWKHADSPIKKKFRAQ